jgi:hypothetical protein
LGVGHKPDNLSQLKKTVKSKDVKTECNLAESSKEGYSSKRCVSPMMMMMMMMIVVHGKKR